MCNRYALDSLDEISDLYQLRSIGSFGFGFVFPRHSAPALLANREARLLPFGIAEKSTGPAYNNARIETPTKWPWLQAIESRRCVIPISVFHEPCYWGVSEGKLVWFRRPDRRLLFAAGIYSDAGMAMWLRPALPYVMEHGHHRSPLLIRPDAVDDWTDPAPRSADDAVGLLREIAETPELTAETDVAMKAGWEKRQAGHFEKRDAQIVASRKAPHACGF